MNDILGLGKIPCQRCGRPHDLRPSTDHPGVSTWADPDDGHLYWPAEAQDTERDRPCADLRLVQIAADQHGLAGLDRDGRVWQHIPGNGWAAVEMNVMEERREP